MGVVSSVALSSSLYNAVPIQANTVSSTVSSELGSPFKLVESRGLDMIATGVSVDDSFKEEIILEKKWRQQLNKEQSQLAFQKSQESTESKLLR